MKKFLVAAMLIPLGVLAQPGPGPGAGQGKGQGKGFAWTQDPKAQEKLQRRMQLARTLGLAEALDVDAKKALELDAVMAKYDEKRVAVRKQMRDAHDVLRKAADGEKVTAQEVDKAIQQGFEARAQMAQLDKETTQAVLKDLNPEQRARAVLFLDRFQRRFTMGGPGNVRVMKHRMGPGGGPGAGAMVGRGPGAMAFSFDGAGPGAQKRVVIAGPDGTRVYEGDEADDVVVSPDFAFDDGFDVEVEVERD